MPTPRADSYSIASGADLWAGRAGTPEYAAGMAAYQVRNLTGTYAPAGAESLEDATPSEWLTSDPSTSKLAGVIAGYSGGGKTVSRQTLIVHGGGHEDGANNGVYVFDLSSALPGWSVRELSAIADVPTSSSVSYEQYNDGRPSSVHTYDAVWMDNSGAIYRAGGSMWRLGEYSKRAWRMTGGGWAQLTPNLDDGGIITPNQSSAIYDPTTDKALVLFGGQQWGRFVSGTTISSAVSLGSANTLTGYSSSAWDSTRGRALVIDANAAYFVTADFSAQTGSYGATLSGLSALTGLGLSVAGYDPLLDCYWAFGGSGAGANWGQIRRIAADGSGYTTHTLTGDAISHLSGQPASYGRTAFEPDWRLIATVAHHQSPVSIIKLPST